MPRKIFVTTALPYANGPFHIGHIMEYIQADIWVRFQRMQGHRGAFRLRGRRARRADHAQGGVGRASRPRSWCGASRPTGRSTSKASTSRSTTGIRRTRRRTPSFRRRSTGALKQAGLHLREAGRAVLRSGEGHVPGGSLHQGRMPELPRQGSVRRCVRGVQLVYAPTDLINPYSTLSGATPVLKTSDHFFFRLSDPKCVAFLEKWLNEPGRLQSQVVNKAKRVAGGQGRPCARGLGHLARCALLRHSDSGCAGQVFLRVAGCADRLPRLAQELLRKRQGARERRAAQLRGVPGRARDRADPFHRQGHHLLPHALLAGDAEVRGRVQGAEPCVRARLHHGIRREDVEVARHGHQPAALSRQSA